jgi:hypothetical protein
MTLYKKLRYDTKKEPPYFIATLHPTQVATFLLSPSLCYHLLHHLLPTYIPLLPTYLPNYPPSISTLPFFCPPSLSIMLLPSLTSCDLHFTITKFSQHLPPWPNLVTPNLCVPWPPTTPSTFHLCHAYICLHLSLFPCHKQAINFKLVIIFLVLYIYMK